MLRIGLTGGIGSGKSLVAMVFRTLGVPVFEADLEARRLMEEDPALKEDLVKEFGDDIMIAGKPDRRRLAGIVFPDPQKLAILNGLVHPRVFESYAAWLEARKSHPYILHEAAILFESGAVSLFDAVITVEAEESLRIKRVMERDGVPASLVRERMDQQWTMEQRVERADYVLLNNEKELLLPSILSLHQTLSQGRLPEK